MKHLALLSLFDPAVDVFSTKIAGLTLLDRAVKLAKVCGATQAVIVTKDVIPTQLDDLNHWLEQNNSRYIPLAVADSYDDAAELISAAAKADNTTIVKSIPVDMIMDRGVYNDAFPEDGHAKTDIITTGLGDDTLALSVINLELSNDLPAELRFETNELNARSYDQRWALEILDDNDARQASDRLFNDCRKDLDGIIDRLFNRNNSIAISKRLAPTSVMPNHATAVSFILGILAASFAALGHWWGFAIAGVLFELNTIMDCVDGELARVRYDFSLRGEWFDTLCDDFSDVFFWTGLGIGAFHSYDMPFFGHTPNIWLWLAGASVLFKLLSMLFYYTWLIAHNRGDLLAFTWSIDDKAKVEESQLKRILHFLKFLVRKDFIVFTAMVLGFLYLQPYLLVAAAPGNFIVAISVAIQRIANRKND